MSSPGTPSGSTAKPLGRTAARSLAFSAAMASTEPKNSMCAGPMEAMAAALGRRMSASGSMSPGWLMPASMTAKRASSGTARTESGRPTSLL